MKNHNRYYPPSSMQRGRRIGLYPTCIVSGVKFHIGEVYLFHCSDSRCPGSSSLWGQYDKHYRGRLYLESSSRDLRIFVKWHILPLRYRYCRRASRSEFRDYIFALSWSEIRSLSPPVLSYLQFIESLIRECSDALNAGGRG